MQALTHGLVGAGSFMALSLSTPEVLNPSVVNLGVAVLGALLPDIDDPRSWLGRRLWPVAYIVSTFTRHRGFTHSLIGALFVISIAIGIFQAGHTAGLALLVGFISHLLADYFSNSGVPLLWPSQRRFHFYWTIQTGGLIEVLLIVLLGITFGYGLINTWHYFQI